MTQSSSINQEKIMQALNEVIAAGDNTSVVGGGRISGLTIRGQDVGFLVAGGSDDEPLRQACEEAVRALGGVGQVTAVLTAHGKPSAPAKAASWNRNPVPGVKRIMAVASGKGGVGKSTMTALLALAMARQGKRVGVLDADIYGPSMPTMLGLRGEVEMQGKQFKPVMAHHVTLMSMGFITGDQATVMRAPRVTKALTQMLRQTAWVAQDAPPLDCLLIDLPPGTGDVHISMVQQAPVDSAVIITLPSEVARLDAHKSVQMFARVDVPITGIIENMSYMEGGAQPFGSGGGAQLAAEVKAPLLASLPLEPAVGALLNQGQNPYDAGIDSPLLDKMLDLAETLM